ncbi:MAG: hypothetical protein ACI4XP_11710, partial [Acutalibacteraceae bacterium]
MFDKFIVEDDITELSKENFKKIISEKAIKHKDVILQYLKKFPYSAYTSQPVFDKFSGEEVFVADNAHTDGVYIWYESEIYHFEKYNLKL